MRRTTQIPSSSLRVGRSCAGLGLFAVEHIKPGMYIEYVGDIIPTAEANKKKGARYLFEVNPKWTIDGSARSNLARYINHACDPNCESVQQGNRIFIKALQDIYPGEELCYDYGPEYFDEFIKPHGCKCGACDTSKVE
jgi:uncharacterized protein